MEGYRTQHYRRRIVRESGARATGMLLRDIVGEALESTNVGLAMSLVERGS